MKRFWSVSGKSFCVLLALVILISACMTVANNIQHDNGGVEIETGSIETTLLDTDDVVHLGYKLYKPAGTTASDSLPAVLCLHGYQNDHETSAAYALELARRGYVALTIDEYGHGSTDAGMIERGYVNHKVTTTYGYDEDGATYVQIGGVTRYKVMMNFSNLTFFADRYSKSVDFETGAINPAESVRDSSMGGTAAYAWLASLPYVDSTNMAITGHSMGTWAAWSVAAAYSGTEIEPRATALQCGELFKTTRDDQGRLAYDADGDGVPEIHFNNVLLVTAKYDEFNYFRDYFKTPVTEDMISNEQRTNFLAVSPAEAAWNTTFHEDFAAGTSTRCEYIITNHRLTTHDKNAVAAIISWFNQAQGQTPSISSDDQIFMTKELLVFASMLMGIASCVAFAFMLKAVPFLADVYGGVPNRPSKLKKGWKFWKGAILTVLISAFTYPFLCQLGHGLMPLPEKIFKMTIGNGFLVWYLFLILVMLGFILIPAAINKKKHLPNPDYVDLGFARNDEKHHGHFDWILLLKSLLVAALSIGFMYLQVLVFEKLFTLDFRFIWPFFKTFTGTRFYQFLVYFPVFALFFILNNSRIFASNRVSGVDVPGFKGFFACWWKYAFCMVGGILLLCLLEYIPFFLQLGPGADLLFSSTFGGPFMSLLIVFAPQVIVFSFVCTACYRKTGNVFLGALLVASMACWIVTGGSAMLYA